MHNQIAAYARFLPARLRQASAPPTSEWFDHGDFDVHMAVRRAAQPPVRLIAFHGAGAHSAALWPFVELLASPDDELVFPDLPLYGRTVVPRRARVRYSDWVDLACALVLAESERDGAPIIVVGASMGGMLAYEVAARTGVPAAVIATCLLDVSDAAGRAAAAGSRLRGHLTPALLAFGDRVAPGAQLPIRRVAPMDRMSNDPELSALCSSDPVGGGGAVPVGFLADWFAFAHTPPERYTGAPVTLTHPADDRWTPAEVSVRFLDQIPGVTRHVPLVNCGHFPIEPPGLDTIVETAAEVRASVLARVTGTS